MESNNFVEKIEKRIDEIDRILKKFLIGWNAVEHNIKIKSIDNAAEIIGNVYFEILKNIKGVYLREDGFANRFKIASGTEIACMLVKPLRFDDLTFQHGQSAIQKLNARLATTISLQILNSLNFKLFGFYLREPQNEQVKAALISHNYWVRYFVGDDNAYPIFLNSTFWEMYVSAIVLEIELEKK